MPVEVVDRIHIMAKKNPVGLDFRDRSNIPLLASLLDNYNNTSIAENAARFTLDNPVDTASSVPTNINNSLNTEVLDNLTGVDQPVDVSSDLTGVNEVTNNFDDSSDPDTTDDTNENNHDSYDVPEADNNSTNNDTDGITETNENNNNDYEHENFDVDNDESDISSAICDNDEDLNCRIATLEKEIDSKYGTPLSTNMQSRKDRNNIPSKFRPLKGSSNTMTGKLMDLKEYAKMYAKIHCSLGVDDNTNFMTNKIVTTILTQHHVSKGLKVFGEKGVDAVLVEMKQLHDR
jgi:hypothetical protein